MAVALTDMVARLTAAVPARDGVPADYAQLVKDAVLQLSQDVPITRETTIAVTSGVASYTVPADFLFVISLDSAGKANGVILAVEGIVPLSDGFTERHTIVGDTITFYPTPGYSSSRTLRYAAFHTLDEEGSYPTLNQNSARIALLYAKHLAKTQQADMVDADGWRYQIGDEVVDKTKQREGPATQAEVALTQYQAAVCQQKGYGGRVRYGV
jgi:hypothetical protein